MLRRHFLAGLLSLPACARLGSQRPPPKGSGRLRTTVSIDWEGAYLRDEGLAELEAFRRAHPALPVSHWLCPAYLTKPDGAYDIADALAQHVKEQDEVALHLHGWASLARAAGVAPKSGPSFFDADGPLVPISDDEGFELELGAYSAEELGAILRRCKTLLAELNIEHLPMFRGGAGILEDHVLETLAREGYTVDTSVIPAQFWRTSHGAPAQMGRRVRDIWGPLDDFCEPFWKDTNAGKLLILPTPPGLADYASLEEYASYIDEAARRLATEPERDQYIHLGFHQENADMIGEVDGRSFRARIEGAIAHLKERYPKLVAFELMSTTARRFGAEV